MKKKTIAGLIAIVAITAVVMFIGCVEKKEVTPSTPTSTPLAPTPKPEAMSTEPSVTETPTPITTLTQPFGKKPDPYFLYPGDVDVKFEYDAAGMAIGGTASKEVRNRGDPGEVFVSVEWLTGAGYNFKVFYMDEDESVMVRGYFKGLKAYGTYPGKEEKFEWTVRPVKPSDTSQGKIDIERSTVKRVGLYAPIESRIFDVAVEGDFAYVIVENYWTDHGRPTLCVVDISDPSEPKEVGHYSFDKPIDMAAFSKYGIAVIDNYAYVAIGHYYEHEDNGLHIIDVSDPSNPQKAGKYHVDGAAYGIAVGGNYAYVATTKAKRRVSEHVVTSVGETALIILDVSTPSNPKEIGRCKIGGALSVTVKDNYAYLVGYERLYVIDVSTPNHPKEIASYNYKGRMVSGRDSIAISDNYAYIVRRDCSLIVFDVSIPFEPTMISKWSPQTECTGQDIAVSGNYAHLATGDGLFIIDISNPSAPTEVGRYAGGRVRCKSVAVSGNYVYLGAKNGLHILSQIQ